MAVSRTSVEPPTAEQESREEGLSVQTLLLAALASGIAAIIVSRFWEQGTILASAMTPVVVAIVSELLKKPVQSERVRRSASVVASGVRPRSGRTPSVMAPPPAGVEEGLRRRENGVEPGPVRVYSSGSNRRPRDIEGAPGGAPRRKLHLKIAVITGLVGFLIAAAVLTLPELIFGGSVSGGSRTTTYFGGGSDSKKSGEEQDGGQSDGQPDSGTQQDDGSANPGDGGQDQPSGSSGGDDSAPDEQQQTSPPSEDAPEPAPTPSVPSAPAP